MAGLKADWTTQWISASGHCARKLATTGAVRQTSPRALGRSRRIRRIGMVLAMRDHCGIGTYLDWSPKPAEIILPIFDAPRP
jgi:hypothetical protein